MSPTTEQFHEEPITQRENSVTLSEEPTSEFTIFGMHLKVYKRRKSVHIDL